MAFHDVKDLCNRWVARRLRLGMIPLLLGNPCRVFEGGNDDVK